MRILHVSSVRTYGGGERHLIDLCRGLANRGNEVFVAVRPTCQWKHKLEFLPEQNIFHISIRNSFGVLSAMRIAEFVRSNGIEIIHAHSARDYIPSNIAAMASKPAKFILTRHLDLPLKPFNRWALSELSCAIAVSESVSTELKRVFPKEKIALIKNGISQPQIDLAKQNELRAQFRNFHGIPDKAILIGTLGELKAQKGHTEFLLAASEICKSRNDAQFVIVGRDNSTGQEFRRDLRRLARTLGIENSVLFLDWLDSTDEFFSAIDLFVSASHFESFGLAMAEAMAFAKPVAATDTAGSRELLPDDALAEPQSPLSLCKIILDKLDDPYRLQIEGDRNKSRILENYSLEKMVLDTEKLYSKILR